ncbi:response regulator [Catalinimonas niigatensis]|uniref:response regulator n=1 Tax=Catalinimonas niigatensis TaxID=1397264 RepID=UPI002666234B|nr:response regulator [Catalinimonas niigatensis]WPP49388.1 response regulator [Catalinimonas niigatensis]
MRALKILIIEDEPKVADFLLQGLLEHGYLPQVAYDGQIGRSMIYGQDYDLYIIDINLPYLNGYELCKIIRQRNEHVPILMLTALGTTEDKLTGFEVGADDYLVKPFEFRELLARIKALLKRGHMSERSGSIIKIADLEINQDAKTVRRNAKKIDLTPKEYALLLYLAQHQGRVISRVDIADKIWDIHFDTGTNVIDVYVNFLRKKVDRDFEPKLIHTMIGMGYVLKVDEEV